LTGGKDRIEKTEQKEIEDMKHNVFEF